MLVRPLGPTLRMRSSLRAGASVTDTDFWAPASTLRAASGESVKIGVAPARLSMKACVVGSSWLMRFLRCYSTVLHPSPENAELSSLLANVGWPYGSLNWPPRSMTCCVSQSRVICRAFHARSVTRQSRLSTSSQSLTGGEAAMKTVFGLAMIVVVVPGASQRQAGNNMGRIGVLTDMSGVYAAPTGSGSVFAARQAAADFLVSRKGLKIEVIAGDHQNKPDIGASIAN